jgi:hypothetical protein
MNDLAKCHSFLADSTWVDCGFIESVNITCMPLAKKMQDLAASPNLNFDGTSNVKERLQNEIIKSLSTVNGNRLDTSKHRSAGMKPKVTTREKVASENEKNLNNDVTKPSESEKVPATQRIQQKKIDINGNEKGYTPVRHMANIPLLHKTEASTVEKTITESKPSSDTNRLADQINEISLVDDSIQNKSLHDARKNKR